MIVELLVVLVPPLLIAFALAMEAVEARLLRREQQPRRAGPRSDQPDDRRRPEKAPPARGTSGPTATAFHDRRTPAVVDAVRIPIAGREPGTPASGPTHVRVAQRAARHDAVNLTSSTGSHRAFGSWISPEAGEVPSPRP
jgi:hypothetical protein